nr:MAG TPA: hypothetical protein [Caudoviricetes sp.]
MTNYEKYKSEIEKITRMGRDIGVEKATNKITACGSLNCEECLFLQYGSNCAARAIEWADAEYIEPEEFDWSKVAVDTPILVSNDNVHWYRKHFAKYKNGEIHAWNGGQTSYTTDTAWHWEYAKLAEVDNE